MTLQTSSRTDAGSDKKHAARLAKTLKQHLPEFEAIAGKVATLSRPEELAVYECDGCLLVKAAPNLVVLPKTAEEISQIVRLCNKHRIPFIARGAGTGLSGGAVPIEGGVIIGLSRMNRILEINPKDRTALVETGVVNATLNQALAPHGLFYAPDPSSQSACTIGGNLAENAGGIHCIKYGVTTDHILGVEVVFPDGQVAWVGGKTRQAHGLNLTGLLVGSEGTLGIMTRAVLRLSQKPKTIRVFLAAFNQTEQATGVASDIIRQGLVPAALEFMDAFTIKAVNAAFHVGFPESSEAVLLIELDGTPEAVAAQEIKLKKILAAHQAAHVLAAESESDRQRLWAARKGAVAAYGRLYPAFYLHDCVIPRSELSSVLTQINAIAKKYDIPIGNVFHAGDGNLHPNILYDPQNPAMVEAVLAGGEEILKLCISVGGVLSGEHGIGLEKSAYMPLMFSENDLAKMALVKNTFDPHRLANPGKILPTRQGCGEAKAAGGKPLSTAISNTNEPDKGLWI